MKSNYSILRRMFVCFLFLVLSLLLAACNSSQEPDSYTVGVIMELGWLQPAYDGFKTSMAELGYVEGENIIYVYDESVTGGDQAAFEAEAKRMVEEDVDLIFAIGTLPARGAQTAVNGTDIPVVFDPVINPVEEGLVQSIANPGGNVTGVQVVNQASKGLEWALQIAPETKHVYIPYNPDDAFITMVLQSFFDSIPEQGVELLPASAVTTPEQMAMTVETLPEDTIIFVGLLSANLEAGLNDLIEQADEYDIPIFSTGRGGDAPFAITDYTTTFAGQAEQGAHMVDRIFRGAKAAETPVETAEYFLFVNLKAAESYDVEISDEILNQAHNVTR